MLIETPYKAGDVVSIKLSSGEEMISRLEEEKADVLVLHKPMMVVAGPQGFGLAPFMFTVSPDAKLNIALKNVICIHRTESEMARQYTSKTSGILV